MDDFEEKKTIQKNPSNPKPNSYFTEFRLNINLNNFVGKLCAAIINAFQDFLLYFAFINELIQQKDIMEA